MISDDCAQWAGLEIPVGLPRMGKNGLPEILEHGHVNVTSHVCFLHSS